MIVPSAMIKLFLPFRDSCLLFQVVMMVLFTGQIFSKMDVFINFYSCV